MKNVTILAIVFSFLLSGLLGAAKTVRECRREYVYCRAGAHCECSGFYTNLSKCSKQYAVCKRDVKASRPGRCKGREWRNSFYFLG